MKRCVKFDLLFMHIQCAPAVHLKKWTLKFKLLYLRNCISYFNKICSICCVNTHVQSLKVWLKYVLWWLKYSIFSRGLFFIGTPSRCSLTCPRTFAGPLPPVTDWCGEPIPLTNPWHQLCLAYQRFLSLLGSRKVHRQLVMDEEAEWA